MLNIFKKIYDALFPPPICVKQIENLSPEKFKQYYCPETLGSVVALANFQQEEVRGAITANKFHQHKLAARLLASLLKEWVDEQNFEKIVFVAIPLSSKRYRERGYNQVTEILKILPETNLRIVELLKRTKHTVPQTSLPRAERLKNVSEAFTFSPQTLPIDVDTVALVDDVTTTGATLEAASKTLKLGLGPKYKIICVSIAH